MSAVLTDAGALHFSQKLASETLTHAFDALELGLGSSPVSRTDTRANMPNRIPGTLVQVSTGYPLLNDQDPDNPGRGAGVISYRFDIPAGVASFTATNFILTNFKAGSPASNEPVAYAAKVSLSKPSAEVLTVFVNINPTDVQVAQGVPQPHKNTHAFGGDDALDAGLLGIVAAPTNYTPLEVTTGAPTARLDAHLKGIDEVLGQVVAPVRDFSAHMLVGGDPELMLTAADGTGDPPTIDPRARIASGYTAVRIDKVALTSIGTTGTDPEINGEIDLAGTRFGFTVPETPGAAVVTIPNGAIIALGQRCSLAFGAIQGSWRGVAATFIGEIVTF